MIASGGQPNRIKPGLARQHGTRLAAIKARISVTGIVNRVQSGLRHQRHQFGLAPTEQRPGNPCASYGSNRPDPGQPANTGATPQAHQQRFGLIINMMGGEQPLAGGKLGQCGIARGPPASMIMRLSIKPGADLYNAQTGTNLTDLRYLGRASRAQAMIDCRYLQLRPIIAMRGEQQQCQAVRPARYRQRKWRAKAKPRTIVTEACA
jgi:hypothetical protein